MKVRDLTLLWITVYIHLVIQYSQSALTDRTLYRVWRRRRRRRRQSWCGRRRPAGRAAALARSCALSWRRAWRPPVRRTDPASNVSWATTSSCPATRERDPTSPNILLSTDNMQNTPGQLIIQEYRYDIISNSQFNSFEHIILFIDRSSDPRDRLYTALAFHTTLLYWSHTCDDRYKQESPANAKGTRDSSACMKAHCEQM